jgi:3-(3-hydroxy-phenyl)propionate hydroxylase
LAQYQRWQQCHLAIKPRVKTPHTMFNTALSSPGPAVASAYEFTRAGGYTLPSYPFTEPPEIKTGQAGRYPVVVVGGGLAGLTMACALAQLGVDTVVLEAGNSVGVQGAASRAMCYSQKSLEIFQRLGIFERVAAKGVQWRMGRTFSGQDEVYSFDQRLQNSANLSDQPAFINIQQFYVAGYLVERLASLEQVQLRWQSRVVAYEPGDGFASLTVQTPAGNYPLQAEHVIDATGSHSPFHAWCQAKMAVLGQEECWAMADVRFTVPQPLERHTWIEAPFNEQRAAWQHPMADEVWRFDWQLAPGTQPDDTRHEEQARARLTRQFGSHVELDILWAGVYAYRSQCLEQLREGRVFFIGDAAKIVTHYASRGASTSIADANNLAWKLAAVLNQQAPASLLDSFHLERHEAALQNIRISQRTARFLSPGSNAERLLRQAVISLAKPYAFARQLTNTGRMAIATSYHHSPICDASGGQSVQNVRFSWADGSVGVVNDLLLWADGNLLILVFGDLSAAACQRLRQITSHAPARGIQVLGAHGRPQAVEHVRDPHGHLQGACRVFGHAWALVRPDGYLAATGEAVDAALVESIEQSLSLK